MSTVALFQHRSVPIACDNDVIQQGNSDALARLRHLFGEDLVLLGRLRVTAWMIVNEDETRRADQKDDAKHVGCRDRGVHLATNRRLMDGHQVVVRVQAQRDDVFLGCGTKVAADVDDGGR